MIPHCSKHPPQRAGWHCDACDADLCPDCAGIRGDGQIEGCLTCGGAVRKLLVSRGTLQPFSLEQLISALGWPFTRAGMLAIFASAVLVTVFGLLGAKARYIAGGVIIAYLFQVVRHTAKGEDDFPEPEDFTDYFADVVGPSWRLTLALAWIWIPALILAFQQRPDAAAQQESAVRQALQPGGAGLNVRGMRVVTNANGGFEVLEAGATPPPPSPEQLLRMQREAAAEAAWAAAHPPPPEKKVPVWTILLIVLGAAIAPMSLLASALKTPLSVAVNPIVLGGYAIKLGRDYFLMAGFCLAVALVEWGLQRGGAALPFPLRLPANFALLILPFGLFRGIGLFVRARGPDLGYGGEEAYLVPALGETRPAGTLAPATEPVTATRRSYAPIELDEVSELAALVEAGNLDGALAHLGQTKAPANALPPASWLELGKVAIQRKKAGPAILALRRCVEAAPAGPHAAQAWLLAARTYAEGLSDRATSDKLLGELARRFPETAEGKFAAARLARP